VWCARSSGIHALAVDGVDNTYVGMSLQRLAGRQTVEWGGSESQPPGPNEFILGTFCALITTQDGSIRFAEWKPIGYESKHQSRDDSTGHTQIVHIDDRSYITALCISMCKKFVYCGMSDGSLRVYEWPVKTAAPSFIEMHAHSAGVVDIRESPTGHIIVTVSEDGSVFVHTILKGQLAALSSGDGGMDMYHMASEMGGMVYNSETVQIAKDDMDDHIQEVFDLRKKIDEMNTKFAFEMHQVCYASSLRNPPYTN
jgi:WD40 repeat protein